MGRGGTSTDEGGSQETDCEASTSYFAQAIMLAIAPQQAIAPPSSKNQPAPSVLSSEESSEEILLAIAFNIVDIWSELFKLT